MSALLEIRDLRVDIPVDGALRTVIHHVTLDVQPGEAVALVGESGSGKSMTARAVMRLLPAGAQVHGELRFDGRSVEELAGTRLRDYRADDVGVIFQDPRTHVNPVRRIGDFLTEALMRVRGMGRAEARGRVAAVLDEVGVLDPETRFRQYPHELSGGLLQRMMIAAVVAMGPRLIVADEPTTALDVTTQSDVMAVLQELCRRRGTGLLLITHDLELAAAVCDRTAVMYAGRIVESRPSTSLYDDPRHPYTAALMAARPGRGRMGERVATLPGRPLSAFEAPAGCAFADRCAFAVDACRGCSPALTPVGDGRAACIRVDALRGRLAPPSPVEELRA